MNLSELKQNFIREELEITDDYGEIACFIDFGNVNNWFDDDRQDWNNKELNNNEVLEIDVVKLLNFSKFFCEHPKCYYGKDPANPGSVSFDYVLRKVFGKHNFISKDLQKIKHYVDLNDEVDDKILKKDKDGGKYFEIRKCNFDVEISVDAIKKINSYDTFCLFSGDADFVYLNNFLKKRGKKIIIIKGGYITTKLRKTADLVINAQKIKKEIAKIKQKPD